MTKKFLNKIILCLCFALILPIVSTVNASAVEPQILGGSAITMDLDTGEIIYSKNADVERSLASTTKLLTSLLFAENVKKGSIIKYTDVSASLRETTLTDFVPSVVAGDTMTADDLMEAVLIYSANDSALMMAEAVSGSVEEFVDLMNKRAAEIGAKNTKFINPNGLEVNDSTYNFTTAYDLALIAREAFKNQWVRETLALSKSSLNLKGFRIDIETRNQTLGENGNIGGKTGTESMAGHCFVGYFNKNNRNLITVVLGSDYGMDGMNVFNDTNAIVNYSVSATKVPFKKAGEEVSTVELEYKLFRFFGPTKTIEVPVILTEDATYYKNDFTDANASINYLADNNNAWKLASDSNVELDFTAGDGSVLLKGKLDVSMMDLLKANTPIYMATALITVIVVILIFALISFINNSKRRRRRRRVRGSRSRYYR